MNHDLQHFKIDTAQNVQIGYELASFEQRARAYFIDMLICVLYVGIVVSILDSIQRELMYYDDVWYLLIGGIPVLLYDAVMEIIFGGQTPGKMLTRIKVMRSDGSAPGMGQYLARWVCRIVDFYVPITGAGVLVYLGSRNGQRIGDLVAGTVVVRVVQEEKSKEAILFSPNPNHEITYPQVSRLSVRDAETIRMVLYRYKITGNVRIMTMLRDKLLQVLEISKEEYKEKKYQSREFLEKIYTDFMHYHYQHDSEE